MNGRWFGWPQGRAARYQTFIGWAHGAANQGLYGGGGSQSWSGGGYAGGDLAAQSWSGGAYAGGDLQAQSWSGGATVS